ncbi:MAG: hypothetical protein DDT19_01056 [Syntrophomonadaceae bacterium]|nr:hypothetical protein [Bacillota bacterium]
MRNLERRDYQLDEIRVTTGDAPKITGYAAVFNRLSQDLSGFREVIAEGAFKKTLQEADVRALLEHDPRWILGTTKSGNLCLWEDKKGLHIELDPPNTIAGRDVVESLQRGDLTGMSFGFRTIKDRWEKDAGQSVRTLLEVALYDVSIVAFPAYPDTSVALRSALAMGLEIEDTSEPVGTLGHSVNHNAEPTAEPSLVDTHRLVKLDLKRKQLEIAEKAL